jgi:hypothetical protein
MVCEWSLIAVILSTKKFLYATGRLDPPDPHPLIVSVSWALVSAPFDGTHQHNFKTKVDGR